MHSLKIVNSGDRIFLLPLRLWNTVGKYYYDTPIAVDIPNLRLQMCLDFLVAKVQCSPDFVQVADVVAACYVYHKNNCFCLFILVIIHVLCRCI